MNPVVHFEMPAQDKERMIKFYEGVFGWQTQKLGQEMGNYILATTTEVDDKQMPKTPGAINGGFYEKSGADAQTRLTIAVDDIQRGNEKSYRCRRQSSWWYVRQRRIRLPFRV